MDKTKTDLYDTGRAAQIARKAAEAAAELGQRDPVGAGRTYADGYGLGILTAYASYDQRWPQWVVVSWKGETVFQTVSNGQLSVQRYNPGDWEAYLQDAHESAQVQISAREEARKAIDAIDAELSATEEQERFCPLSDLPELRARVKELKKELAKAGRGGKPEKAEVAI